MKRRRSCDCEDEPAKKIRDPLSTTVAEPYSGETPVPRFLDCVKEGNIKLVKEHLSRGEQVGINNKLGPSLRTSSQDFTTGFHYACKNGHTELINLLLAGDDVDVNSKDYYGKSGFHYACMNGHAEIVNLLFASDDVDLNFKDIIGTTGFHFACMNGQIEVIKLLLTREDVDVTFADFLGRTGFHLACEKLCDASPRLVGEIGAQMCIQRNIQPSELVHNAPMHSDPKLMEEIQASIRRKQQKSARK